MRRAFWFAAGAATGVYGMVKARRALEVVTPDGIGARVAAAREGARVFAGAVAEGMQAREADLLAELRASQADPPELAAAPERPELPTTTTPESSADGHR